MPASTRLALDIERGDKELLWQAAALTGTTLASFVRTAAREKARAILEQEQQITLSPRDFAAITTALDRAFEPNTSLKTAISCARASVR
jgi:uncharacterized protein (DUF1778 family)